MLRIIRNRPRYNPGGPTGIQDLNEDAKTTSTSQTMMTDGSDIGPYYQTVQPNAPILQNSVQGIGVSNPVSGITGNQMVSDYETAMVSDERQRQLDEEKKRSQDGNVFDPMNLPYFAPDLTSRAQMMGRAIGNIRTAKDTGNAGLGTIGVLGTVASGISLGMGLAREIAGASSEQYAASRDYRSAQQRLARERRNAMITYQKQGGGGINVDGRRIDTSSMTGEYIYPLPKSMEDNANVEIEKGEYTIVPDVVGPMEAKGEKHSKGGTLVNLPEAYIISDYRKIPEEFASAVRSAYGIKATPKDTYASLVDKYKKKIGLKEAYEEQEKVIKRLEKTESIKDSNTAELNKSILSKYINENQKKIDELEADLRDFADVVYKRQEDDKIAEERRFFFREGGPIDKKTVKDAAAKLGVDEEEARNMLFDSYKKKTKMPNGGDTELARLRADAMRRYFDRQLTMGVVDVVGREDILNPNSDVNANQGLQHAGRYGYGRLNENAVRNLLDVNRYARGLNQNGNFTDNVREFQTDYQRRLNDIYALADAGLFSNADAARDFVTSYNFYGEDSTGNSSGQRPTSGPTSDFGSFEIDDKFGQTTATRGFISMDVLTPDELKKLNDADIKNYVDIRNNPDQVKELLGEDSAAWKAFDQMNKDKNFSDFDFVLGSYTPAPDLGRIEVPDEDIQLVEPIDLPGAPGERVQTRTVNPNVLNDLEVVDNTGGTGIRGAGLIFPEILRDRQSGIVTEGLERHYTPRVDPVLRSADQYINELNRATSSQLDAMGDVPDSQRAAIMANMNAIAGSNIARYINEVDLYNAQQRNEADRFNQTAYARTVDQNIAERQRYQESTLRAMAISDENRARYLDNLNQEAMQKFNTLPSINTIRSIAPNMRVLPNGQIVYTDNGEDIMTYGDFSTPYLYSMAQQYQYNPRAYQPRRTTSSTTGTTTTTTTKRFGGRI